MLDLILILTKIDHRIQTLPSMVLALTEDLTSYSYCLL